jgi:hypothetical protein
MAAWARAAAVGAHQGVGPEPPARVGDGGGVFQVDAVGGEGAGQGVVASRHEGDAGHTAALASLA